MWQIKLDTIKKRFFQKFYKSDEEYFIYLGLWFVDIFGKLQSETRQREIILGKLKSAKIIPKQFLPLTIKEKDGAVVRFCNFCKIVGKNINRSNTITSFFHPFHNSTIYMDAVSILLFHSTNLMCYMCYNSTRQTNLLAKQSWCLFRMTWTGVKQPRKHQT